MESRKMAALLALLFALTSLAALVPEVPPRQGGLDEVVVVDGDLTSEQRVSLAGARVSTGNWLHHVGGIGTDQGIVSRLAPNGDLYVAGIVCHGAGTCSAIFGATTIYANNDIFVAKLSSNGTWLWIAQSTGTNSNSYAYLTDMDIDSFGNVFISGYFRYTKTFGTISVSPTQNAGQNDGFAARLGSTGTWAWVNTMNNYDYGYARGIAVDSNQNVYVTGESRMYYSSTNYRYTYFSGDAIQTTCNSWRYWPWLVKYNGAGSLQWVDRISDNCNDRYAKDVIVDSNDSAIVTGYFDNTLSFASMTTSSAGSWDIYLAKVDSSHTWQWLTHGGGLSSDQPEKLAVDSNDDIYVVGWNDNHASYGTTIILANSGGFVVKALGNGTWEWGTRISPTYRVEDIAVHPNHNLTVIGDRYITHLNSTGAQQWYESKAQSLYSLALDGNNTSYITGHFSGSQYFENNYLVSNGSNDLLIWKWDRDRDGDSVADRLDNCGSNSNGNQDDYDGDGPGDACDADDDNDGFLDVADNCPRGDMNWTSNATTDRDDDGCQDSGEDLDDDDDLVEDSVDACPTGLLNWTSNGATDHDVDGCNDASEDADDDNDGVQDSADLCALGDVGWISNSTSDHDSDGCKDSGEDADDDGDGVGDGVDQCPEGDIGWISGSLTDHDSDGCQDLLEDPDDDGDAALDGVDLCPTGVLNWIRYVSADYDDDGCRDSDEDADDDNDDVTDHRDLCALGELGWKSNATTDNDGDGCRDATEDIDDDNDGISDVNDFCAQGDIGWTSGRVTDHDSDGCHDNSEDMDDDGDGVEDGNDTCSKGMVGWTSNGGSDYDGDGCLDATEDGDDDGDGIIDYADPCPFGDDNCGTSGAGGNVTIIHQYPENSTENESSPVTTTVIHYYNNSTTIVYYHNNSTSTTIQPPNTGVNQTNTTVEHDEPATESEVSDEDGLASAGILDAVSTVSLLLIALFVLVLVIGQMRASKQRSEPDSELLNDEDYAFSGTAEVEAALEEEAERGLSSKEDLGQEMVDPEVVESELGPAVESEPELEIEESGSDTPSVDLQGVMSTDGHEWAEYPMGSGKHWFRPGSGDEWQLWEK
jgi:hypothetical protein